MSRRIVTALALVVASALPGTASAADDFYRARLQEGRIAYQAGSASEAVDLLRIACFGLMEDPELLSEGLVFLVLAQEKLGRAADEDGALRRFFEIEKRFGTYGKAAVPAEARKEFEAALVRRMPPEALLSVPTLARFVETEEQKIQKLPPAERRRALEAKAREDAANPAWPLALARLAEEVSAPKDVVKWAGRTLELDPQNAEARQLRVRALTARKAYRDAVADLELLPPSAFAASPVLRADRFVVLAATKSWDAAREAAAGLTEEQGARPDVAEALKKLPAAEPAAAEAPADAAAQAPRVAAAPAVSAPAAAAPPVSAPPVSAPPATATAAAPPVPQASIEALKAEVHEALRAGKAEKAKGIAAAAVGARPDDREARKLLLEAACMSRDWKTVAAQARAVAPFADGEEPSMFYAAVGLWETGSREEARPLMKRARPRIAATPFVNYYAERILGEAQGR